jgi:hypothetical protein
MSGNINIKSFLSKTARFIVLEAAALLNGLFFLAAVEFVAPGVTLTGLIGLENWFTAEKFLWGCITLLVFILLHLHIFGKYFIKYYVYREAESGGCLEPAGRRSDAAAARLREMLAAYVAVLLAVSFIYAPFGGGALSMLTVAFLGRPAGGIIATAAVSFFALRCRAGNFSDAAHRRIKIFGVAMIFNYALALRTAFEPALGMVIFSSVIYLKSYKLGVLKKIKTLGRDEWLRTAQKPATHYIIIESACILCLFFIFSGEALPMLPDEVVLLLILFALTVHVLYDESRNSLPRSDENLS